MPERRLEVAPYNLAMPLIDQIQKDIVAAMKGREEHRLSTLRMVKTALKNRVRSRRWHRLTIKNHSRCSPR